MNSCLRIPRVFLPEENFENWCAAPGDPSSENLSARSCLPPLGKETDEEALSSMREKMYSVLADRTIGRLYRGIVVVKRTGVNGERRGILAVADLEEYAPAGSKTAMLRATTETDPQIVERLASVRSRALFELPTAVFCYRDKRNKIMRALDEEEMDPLYDFSFRGERLEGFFAPDYVAAEVLEDLTRCGDPCFGVLDGNHSLAAAKLHWERVRANLPPREVANHPARFALAEFVNLADPAVLIETAEGVPVKKEDLLSHWKAGKLYPVHSLRLLSPRFLLEAREISYD